MKSCWDPNPKKRPSIIKIRNTFGSWFYKNKNMEQFNQAEIKRKELINLKKLGPKFSEKAHSDAIYTSRPLSFFISKVSSTKSSNSSLKDNTIELELDIDIESLSSSNSNQNSSTIQQQNVTYINRPLNSLTTSLGKRNIEELNVETHDNGGKHIKNY
ncbi:hypothetical protein C1645_742718 [Glomus cerebriforme]|uniref:Serine-threonine/tyrosine-protein kinase catalytic domain-containing protein n=1 Tax=Glomus cerebriforme TaxID=658196 RepID=A0A397SGB0_9GLOM|nr:hypothetical protein C1645_742718 [Glomus cerebriforme]